MVPKDDALSCLSRDLVLELCLTLPMLPPGDEAHSGGNVCNPRQKAQRAAQWALQLIYVTSAHSGKWNQSVSARVGKHSGVGTKRNMQRPDLNTHTHTHTHARCGEQWIITGKALQTPDHYTQP